MLLCTDEDYSTDPKGEHTCKYEGDVKIIHVKEGEYKKGMKRKVVSEGPHDFCVVYSWGGFGNKVADAFSNIDAFGIIDNVFAEWDVEFYCLPMDHPDNVAVIKRHKREIDKLEKAYLESQEEINELDSVLSERKLEFVRERDNINREREERKRERDRIKQEAEKRWEERRRDREARMMEFDRLINEHTLEKEKKKFLREKEKLLREKVLEEKRKRKEEEKKEREKKREEKRRERIRQLKEERKQKRDEISAEIGRIKYSISERRKKIEKLELYKLFISKMQDLFIEKLFVYELDNELDENGKKIVVVRSLEERIKECFALCKMWKPKGVNFDAFIKAFEKFTQPSQSPKSNKVSVEELARQQSSFELNLDSLFKLSKKVKLTPGALEAGSKSH